MERGAGLPLLRRRLRAAAGPVGNDVTATLPQVFPVVHILACFPGKVLTIWGSLGKICSQRVLRIPPHAEQFIFDTKSDCR